MLARRPTLLRVATLLTLAGLLTLAAACTDAADETSRTTAPAQDAWAGAPGESVVPVIEIHRSAACACCGDYEEYLAAHGVEVRTVVREDLVQVKAGIGLPGELASCHTGFVAGYFVEGHVPIDAIRDLLERQPSTDGIALPGMPAGSPGMGGKQAAPFVILSVTNGNVEAWGTY